MVLTSLPAAAKVQLYATLTVHGVPPQDCTLASAIVTPLIDEFHGPSDWTWIIVCDEAAWHRVERHIGHSDLAGGSILGAIDLLEDHVTYVRGYYVLHPFITQPLWLSPGTPSPTSWANHDRQSGRAEGRASGKLSRKFLPQLHNASMIGFRLSPSFEIEYSILGGT